MNIFASRFLDWWSHSVFLDIRRYLLDFLLSFVFIFSSVPSYMLLESVSGIEAWPAGSQGVPAVRYDSKLSGVSLDRIKLGSR